MSSARSIVLALAGLLSLAAPAAAQGPPSIDLPPGVQAEAATAHGKYVYFGDFYGGAVWRINPRGGEPEPIVEGQEGRAAMGIAFKGDRMVVAGGLTGDVYVYDRNTGEELATYDLGGALVNDVTILGNTAYATDTFKDVFYAIPLGNRRAQPRTIELDGVPFRAGTAEQPRVNADGIVTIRGRLLLNHYDTGRLFTVNPRTGKARRVAIGETLPTADGMVVRGNMLYVTQNSGAFSRIRLSRNLRSGRILATDKGDAYQNPVDVARSHGAFWVLNTPKLLEQDEDAVSYFLQR